MIKIYNPRHFLRKGFSDPMQYAAAGHTVLIRCGEVAPSGDPVVFNPKTGNAGHAFDGVRDKVFKLVECTPAEVARFQKRLNLEK